MKYTKKRVTIDAILLEPTPLSIKRALEFMGEVVNLSHPIASDSFDSFCDAQMVRGGMEIKTSEGVMLASFGDYIIKGVKGEFYPCKPDIFAATYDEGEMSVKTEEVSHTLPNTKHTSTCLLKAADDEPIFVLRAKDPTAPDLIRSWVFENEVKNLQPEQKLLDAMNLSARMESWRVANEK